MSSEDFVEKLTKASTEAKSILHELYAANKDCRKVIKELNEMIEKAANFKAVEAVDREVNVRIKEQIEALGEHTKEAMDKATDKVNKEFEKLANLFLEGSKDGRPSNGFSLRSYVEKKSREVK